MSGKQDSRGARPNAGLAREFGQMRIPLPDLPRPSEQRPTHCSRCGGHLVGDDTRGWRRVEWVCLMCGRTAV